MFDDKLPEIKESLKEILNEQEIVKYHQFFATLIIMELEAEKDGGEAGLFKTLKNIHATATFGRF